MRLDLRAYGGGDAALIGWLVLDVRGDCRADSWVEVSVPREYWMRTTPKSNR
jgi:hypothetical protein